MKLTRIYGIVFIISLCMGCNKSKDSENDLLTSYGSGCGIEMGTNISMADGSMKRTEEVKIDDYIILEDGSTRKVYSTSEGVEVYPMISIKTKEGRNIILTRGTVIKTTKGWVAAAQLNYGTEIPVQNGVDIVSVATYIMYNQKIYSLQFGRVETAFIANGFIIGDETISERILGRE